MAHSVPPPKAKSSGSSRYERITPPRDLRKLVSYREMRRGEVTPVEQADQQLLELGKEFDGWLEEVLGRVQTCFKALSAAQGSAECYQQFHAAIHEMRGNGAILGSAAASDIAAPVARLLERCPEIQDYVSVIGLALATMEIAIHGKLGADDPRVVEVVGGLERILARALRS